MAHNPLNVVFASATTYGCALLGLQYSTANNIGRPETAMKVISGVHSLATTCAALYALSGDWPIVESFTPSPDIFPDDLRNPMISGKSHFGNVITGFETGYLLYDTLALLLISGQVQSSHISGGWAPTVLETVRRNPVTLGHHIALGAALGSLQVYIHQGRERGVWIIVAFILMNASTPVLHYRWWQRKVKGRPSFALDAAFAGAFAACRFGTILYVLHRYGAFHHISGFEAIRKQRWICQLGTGALLALNGVWWSNLVKGIFVRFRRNTYSQG